MSERRAGDAKDATKPVDAIDAVGGTALLVAAMRAAESEREGRLFDDPFARKLAGDEGMAMLARAHARGLHKVPLVEVRTRFFDDRLREAMTAGLRQVVILAAGMDARAYRLDWPSAPTATRLYEVDRAPVLAWKNERLASDSPRGCERVTVAEDVNGDWPAKLAEAGFRAAEPTAWLVEGLLVYLEEPVVHALLARVSGLSASGSRLLFDVPGRALFESTVSAPAVNAMAARGSPWRFGTDDPEGLVRPLDWSATATEPSAYAAPFGRWPAPADGSPRKLAHSFFVAATKR